MSHVKQLKQTLMYQPQQSALQQQKVQSDKDKLD